MKKIISCVLVSIFVSINAFSQSPATGCLLPNNRVFTSKGILGTYYNNVSVGLAVNYCSWSPKTGPSCSVCNTAINPAGLCLGTTMTGIEGTFTMVPCNLDERSSIIVALSGIIGVIVLRKRSMC